MKREKDTHSTFYCQILRLLDQFSVLKMSIDQFVGTTISPRDKISIFERPHELNFMAFSPLLVLLATGMSSKKKKKMWMNFMKT